MAGQPPRKPQPPQIVLFNLKKKRNIYKDICNCDLRLLVLKVIAGWFSGSLWELNVLFVGSRFRGRLVAYESFKNFWNRCFDLLRKDNFDDTTPWVRTSLPLQGQVNILGRADTCKKRRDEEDAPLMSMAWRDKIPLDSLVPIFRL
jgi:hypothetical protein